MSAVADLSPRRATREMPADEAIAAYGETQAERARARDLQLATARLTEMRFFAAIDLLRSQASMSGLLPIGEADIAKAVSIADRVLGLVSK
jgi:hypothetical protein